MPDTVRFEARGAVRELFRSTDTEVLLSGAAGTGKSVGALMYVHLQCLDNPKTRALIVRKTHASLTSSTLVSFREKVAREAIDAGLLHFFGGSAQEPASYRYANGSVIVVGGLDRPTKLLSTEFDLVLVDEAIEVTAEDLDTIVSRLRNGVLPLQRLIMCTNPGPPSHHLKLRADSGRCRILYSRHEDNPRLYQNGEWTEYGNAYLARLDSLTGPRYQRLRWGKWVSAEGVIYDEWQDVVHLVDRFAIPDAWQRYISIDFGFTNPMVIQWWAQDGDGRLYLYREIYKTRTLAEDHAKQVKRIIGETGEPHPVAVVCDHDAEDRATFEKHSGLFTTPAKKTVSPGIQAVQTRIRPAGDGRPRLFILRDSVVDRDQDLIDAGKPTSTVDEINGYVWAVKPGAAGGLKEQPLKQDDHGMDAMRYMVAAVDLVGVARVQSPARRVPGVSAAASRYARPVAGGAGR
ncbi:phage terminase large subunit [Streptomyces pimonensis]